MKLKKIVFHSLKSVSLLAVLSVALVSCKDSDPDPQPIPEAFGSGVYIVNEGAYGQGNGDITYYNPNTSALNQAIFKTANTRPLGDVPTDILFNGSKNYIVVNNSQPTKIEVVNAGNCKSVSLITGFSSPRQILKINEDLAYISDIAAGKIHKIDLKKDAYLGFIPTQKAVEQMLKFGDKVFAANWSNAYVEGDNSTLQVIDINSNTVVHTLNLVKEPQSMVLDKNNKLWVLCAGGWDPKSDTLPALYCINPTTYTIEKTLWFANKSMAPSNLKLSTDKASLYYLLGANIYKLSLDATAIPATEAAYIKTTAMGLYNMGIDPKTGDIYVTNPKDYSQNGEVLRYDKMGKFIKSISTGVVPSAVLFK
ncbi:MAG: SMP-30/gluconolactonase/LRE family protein [Bacteroidales bacterium]